MPTGGDQPQALRFGEFTLDASRLTLLRGEDRLHLTEKPLEVLVLLVQSAGRTVSKAELMEAVWKGTFVTEDNLTQAILKIRRALGDEKEHPQFILTVPRVGYRFIGPAASPGRSPAAAGQAAAGEPVRRRRTRPAVILAAGVVVISAATGFWRAGYFGGAPRAEPPTTPAAAPVPEEIPLPTASATKPAYAPDGSNFLFVGYRRERPGIGDIYLASASGTHVRPLTQEMDPRGDHPVFSPDGTEVVFSRWRNGDDGTRWPDLWVAPVAGGQPRLLIEQSSGAGFSPDGRWIGYTKHLPGGRPLWISPRSDLNRHREVGPHGFTPRWSPDGRWLAYTTSNPEGGTGDLWIASVDLSVRKRLSREPEQFFGIVWAPDSLSVVVASDQGGTFGLWSMSSDGASRTSLGRGIGGYFSPSVSPDGRMLLFSHVIPSRNLCFASTPGGESELDLTRGQYHVWPVLSPDGRQVLSVIRAPGFGNRAYVTSVDRRQTVQASDRPALYPVWVDGDHMAYLHEDSTGGTEVRLATVPAGDDRPLCRFPERASWLAVHPSGRQVAAVLTAPDSRQRIVVRDLDTRRDTTVTEGNEYERLRWVPGGRLLSWSGPVKSAGPGSDGIWMADPRGSGPERIVADGNNPVWSDDDTKVYYSRIGDHSGLWCYDRKRFSEARIRTWTEVDSFDIRGQSLVFARIASDTHIFRLSLK
jgi:Tol biopolymer transport system component/DNA-binding winged helix-turn-helix (wHTH) protein